VLIWFVFDCFLEGLCFSNLYNVAFLLFFIGNYPDWNLIERRSKSNE
jgi:hypothetical protein